ncbi:MAG TPA: hypothetical protein PLF81_23260, partial [Candidatus Anammoximicrobium sp.]|nr:hypothetical protein [Candidatus Anammoximicrobium sp.]
ILRDGECKGQKTAPQDVASMSLTTPAPALVRWTKPTLFGKMHDTAGVLPMSGEVATELHHFHEFLGQQLQAEGPP